MIYLFDDSQAINSKLTGGKAASLAKLTQNSIPVPTGFVISSEVFKSVVQINSVNNILRNALKNISVNETEKINELSIQLTKIILSLDIPKDISDIIFTTCDKMNLSLVAVRSSATSEDSKTDSWAGELETFLNTRIIDLEEKIKQCWASIYSPRALTYQLERNIYSRSAGVAVVVQEMIQSEISGVAFTVHPVSLRRDLLLIEAVYGLGEGIVSGQITPDSYLVDKESLTLLKVKSINQIKQLALSKSLKGIEWEDVENKNQHREKLTYTQVQEISKLCIQMEHLYNHPQDIEWAFRNNSFFITQSRPITTLD